MWHLSTEFYENKLSSFCVILLTNRLTNADENITSLAELNTHSDYLLITFSQHRLKTRLFSAVLNRGLSLLGWIRIVWSAHGH